MQREILVVNIIDMPMYLFLSHTGITAGQYCDEFLMQTPFEFLCITSHNSGILAYKQTFYSHTGITADQLSFYVCLLCGNT